MNRVSARPGRRRERHKKVWTRVTASFLPMAQASRVSQSHLPVQKRRRSWASCQVLSNSSDMISGVITAALIVLVIYGTPGQHEDEEFYVTRRKKVLWRPARKSWLPDGAAEEGDLLAGGGPGVLLLSSRDLGNIGLTRG